MTRETGYAPDAAGGGAVKSEQDLVERAKAGDRAAFDALLAPAAGKARGAVRQMIGHPDDAEDVFQNACVKAWRKIDAFKGDALFSTWLCSIAVREAIDHLRASKRWRREAQVAYANLCAEDEALSGEVTNAFAAPDFSFELREHVAYCFACVGRSLPPDEQAALVARDVMGFSGREAATVLGVSDAVMRHRLSAARMAMTERYDGLCALVSKTGICHQCKGLREVAAMAGGKPEALPDVADLADRIAIVRDAARKGSGKGACKSAALHDLFWRRTKEIEEKGLGSTEPQSDCGQD